MKRNPLSATGVRCRKEIRTGGAGQRLTRRPARTTRVVFKKMKKESITTPQKGGLISTLKGSLFLSPQYDAWHLRGRQSPPRAQSYGQGQKRLSRKRERMKARKIETCTTEFAELFFFYPIGRPAVAEALARQVPIG